ncbi:hypothetical protein CHU98_g3041 [Xylaria longipes]|nr:hypothetical protein CHU98_g3041 [Xylaria longipes]
MQVGQIHRFSRERSEGDGAQRHGKYQYQNTTAPRNAWRSCCHSLPDYSEEAKAFFSNAVLQHRYAAAGTYLGKVTSQAVQRTVGIYAALLLYRDNESRPDDLESVAASPVGNDKIGMGTLGAAPFVAVSSELRLHNL